MKKRVGTKENILSYVVEFKYENDGLSPSYRKMATDLGLSIGMLQRSILEMIEAGDLKRGPRNGLMVKPFNGWGNYHISRSPNEA